MTAKKSETGFTLIEVLASTFILAIILIAAVGYAIRLVFSMRVTENRVRAQFYAEEVQEWLASIREDNWQTLEAEATVGGSTYCINDPIELNSAISHYPSMPCTGYDGVSGEPPAIFKRELVLSKDSATNATQVTATINVAWLQNNQEFSVPIEVVFTSWE